MFRHLCLLWTVAVLLFLTGPASGAGNPFSFSTGLPDGRIAAASRIESGALIEIETGDDFITTADQTQIVTAQFWGLLPGNTQPANIDQVTIEIYRVFPLDSTSPPDGRVPTRVNSPSDIAFDSRSSSSGQLTFAVANLGNFLAANSVVNGIHPIPNQTTLGEGSVAGIQVRIDVTFVSPFKLPPGHYFFVPQVRLSNEATFLWLSAHGNQPPLFVGDLQAWIRNANLDPDWLRIGTDIIDGNPVVTFNMAFAVAGSSSLCVSTPTTLCIDDQPGDGRFQIQVAFQTTQGGGSAGDAHAIPLASLGVTHGGLFWFFEADNPELLVKVLPKCPDNGHHWFFASAGTNVGVVITVTDLQTGVHRVYTNPDRQAMLPIQDISAFGCP